VIRSNEQNALQQKPKGIHTHNTMIFNDLIERSNCLNIWELLSGTTLPGQQPRRTLGWIVNADGVSYACSRAAGADFFVRFDGSRQEHRRHRNRTIVVCEWQSGPAPSRRGFRAG